MHRHSTMILNPNHIQQYKNLEILFNSVYQRLFILYEIRIFNEAMSMECFGRYVRRLVHWTVCHCHTSISYHTSHYTHTHMCIWTFYVHTSKNNSTIIYVWFNVITTIPCLMRVVWQLPKWDIHRYMHTLTSHFQWQPKQAHILTISDGSKIQLTSDRERGKSCRNVQKKPIHDDFIALDE